MNRSIELALLMGSARVVFLCVAVAIVVDGARHGSSRGHSSKDEAARRNYNFLGKNPADSVTIDGADCGHAKQVIKQWSLATKVGTYAGKARGAISEATAAGGVLEAAIKHANETATQLTSAGAPLPEDLKMALEGSGGQGAIDKASEAALELETELGTFKTKASGSTMAGADIESSDLRKVQDLTDKTLAAAKGCRGAAQDLDKKASKAKEAALQSTETTLRLIKGLIESTEPVIEAAKLANESVEIAIENATSFTNVSEELYDKLRVAAAGAGEQQPVVEAAAADIKLLEDGVKETVGELPTLKGELNTNFQSLEHAVDALEDAKADAEGGSAVPNMGEQLTKADVAVGKVEGSISEIEAKIRTLHSRQDRLGEASEVAGKNFTSEETAGA